MFLEGLDMKINIDDVFVNMNIKYYDLEYWVIYVVVFC